LSQYVSQLHHIATKYQCIPQSLDSAAETATPNDVQYDITPEPFSNDKFTQNAGDMAKSISTAYVIRNLDKFDVKNTVADIGLVMKPSITCDKGVAMQKFLGDPSRSPSSANEYT